MDAGEVGVGIGRAGDFWVGDGSCFWHTVLEKGVHFITSSSPFLHLQIHTMFNIKEKLWI